MKLLSCITYECMDIVYKIFRYVNSVSRLCLHLRDAASVMIELGLEVETLEEPLYVSSPLGIRARIGMICHGCELEISGILLTKGPEGYGHVRVRCHPGDGLADSL